MKITAQGSFLVTGASGQLGRRVVEILLEANAGPIIATTRSPDKLSDFTGRGVDVRAADFNDPASLSTAFSGAKRLLIISTDDLEPGKRLTAHREAINSAVAAGVEHIVYTSLTNPAEESPISFAGDHRETEAMLAASGVGHTILRNNLYTDLILMSAPQALGMGKLFAATAEGEASYVTREDCAQAAAAALMRETETKTYDITGPGLVSQAALAKILSEISGREIPYIPISVADLRAAMIDNGLSEMMADVFSSFDEAIAKDYFAVNTSAVEDLTGRGSTSVRQFLLDNKAALMTSDS